jgi:hypothetical protein
VLFTPQDYTTAVGKPQKEHSWTFKSNSQADAATEKLEVGCQMRRAKEHAAKGNPVLVASGPVILEAQLYITEGAEDIVLFHHGSGSSRLSTCNQFVAQGQGMTSISDMRHQPSGWLAA